MTDPQRTVDLRALTSTDSRPLETAFLALNKAASTFDRYVAEQAEVTRMCWVARSDGEIAGYVTLLWSSPYQGLAGSDTPEIQDLNVVPHLRRWGIGSRLLDEAEAAASTRSSTVAIGVGVHAGYNAAQRLYVLRGYVPDGKGLTYGDRYVGEYEDVTLDDSLVLHMTKEMR